MRIVIVDRDQESIQPLIDELAAASFDVTVVENSAGVLSFIKHNSVQFLVADSSLLVGHTLGQAVRRQSPLVRLIVLAAYPSLLGMVEAISSGATDYFPKRPEYFTRLTATIAEERKRLVRWQHALLDETGLAG